MPNSEEYVKHGESMLITTTGRIFYLHHCNNKLSFWQNIYTQRFRNDFAFKWCQIAREWLDILEVISCWMWNWQYFLWKHQIHPIVFLRQSLYAMPNHLPIICQNLIVIIWKLLSEQLEFWKAQSLKNGYGSPRTYNMQNSE